MARRQLPLNFDDPPQLLSIPEAAEILRVPVSCLYHEAYRQRINLPAIRIGRRILFTLSDIKRLIGRAEEFDPGAHVAEQA